jgi:hypothetical protein
MFAELILIFVFLFQENKSYGVKKTICIDPLLHAAVHHNANTNSDRSLQNKSHGD